MEKRTIRILIPGEKGEPDTRLALPERFSHAQAYPLQLVSESELTQFPKALALLAPESKRTEALALVKREYAVELGREEKPEETTLEIHVTGLRSTKGKVLLSLFSGPEGFPSKGEKALVAILEITPEKEARHRFVGVKPGVYAAVFLHDENDNGKLDTGAFGIPKEGFGTSNDPRVRMGPPRFKDAAFAITGAGAEREVTIKTTYL